MVELDAGLIQLCLQASEKAPSGCGTVDSPHGVKGSRDSCTHGKLVPYSVPPCPCSGKISLCNALGFKHFSKTEQCISKRKSLLVLSFISSQVDQTICSIMLGSVLQFTELKYNGINC